MHYVPRPPVNPDNVTDPATMNYVPTAPVSPDNVTDTPELRAIMSKADALGRAFTGAPVSWMESGYGGHRIRYTKCDIYYTPATGAHEVHGAIRDRFNAVGSVAIGYPFTDEESTSDGIGRVNRFSSTMAVATPWMREAPQPASIYWHPESGTTVIRGSTAPHRIETEEIRRLTGEFTLENDTSLAGNVTGTDLGHMFDLDGKLYMVFGDTYGRGTRYAGGPQGDHRDWRSNVMAVIPEWRHDGNAGLVGPKFPRQGFSGLNWSFIADRALHAKELLPGAKQQDGTGEVTKIPTNGIAVGGRIFLHYMSIHDWRIPVTNYSALGYSDDQGQTWNYSARIWPSNSNFAQVAFTRHEDHVYLFGIPAGRKGGVKLARVPSDRDRMLDQSAYEYFHADNGWVPANESGALEIIPGPVGELSVMYNHFLRRWIALYVSERDHGIWLRDAPILTGPWSAPKPVWPEEGAYGAYIHPYLIENDGEYIYFTMSRWGPYQVYMMRARLVVE